MQFSVYDVMRKITVMHDILTKIENGESINDRAPDIRDILEEYSDILQCAKVNV
jgi:hypothetical protein